MPTPSEPERPRKPPASDLGAWGRYAGLGMQFAATVGVFVALGLWGDSALGTGPWLVLAGVLIGFSGGLYALIRAVPPARGGTHGPDRTRPTPPEPPQPPDPPA